MTLLSTEGYFINKFETKTVRGASVSEKTSSVALLVVVLAAAIAWLRAW